MADGPRLMITFRTFKVTLYGKLQEMACFSGEEYTAETVKQFLIKNDKLSQDIEVSLVRETKK